LDNLAKNQCGAAEVVSQKAFNFAGIAMRPVMPLIFEVSLAKLVVLFAIPTQKSVGVDGIFRLYMILPYRERVVAVRMRLRSFHYGCSFRVFQRVAAEFSVVGSRSHRAGGEGSYNATKPLSFRKGKGGKPFG